MTEPPRQHTRRHAHVVITGASSGLGAALARAHAEPGVRLSLGGRDAARLAAIAAECRQRGAEVVAEACDVADADAMARWLAAADDARPVDLVYANAGIGGSTVLAGAAGEAPGVAQAVFATNALGVVNTVTPLLPRLVARRAGHIVVIASLAGLAGLPHTPAYCGSKAAVRVYAEGLRRLLRPSGVRVLTVNAGYVATPMSASLPGQAPFTWSAADTAAAIGRAVAAGRAELTFPWPLRLALLAARLLPTGFVDMLLANAWTRGIGR